jgi:uncharacterized membrane protein
MKVINSSRRLPESQLKVLAAFGWVAVLYLCWVVGQSSWERTMFSFGALAGVIPAIDPFNDRYTAAPVMTLLHTIPGLLFAILGPLQFMGPIRRRFPAIHRLSGRIFVPVGVVSGVGAFVMTFRLPIWGMSLNYLVSAAFAVVMVFAFIKAVMLARAKQFVAHREWMIRGFAIGIGVAFFRVMLNDVLPQMGMEDFTMRWNTVVSTSFLVTLTVGELWIRATRPRSKAKQTAPTAAAASA